MNNSNSDTLDLNPDPITGAPGSHPVGTGLGSASGAAAGAAVGAGFGPLGFLIGGTVGAIAGAMAGHHIAETIDPTAELDYWRGQFGTRPYIDPKRSFELDYLPAFEFGVSSRNTKRNRGWDQTLETELKGDWDSQQAGTGSSLGWYEALPAVRDAWERTDRSFAAYDVSDRYFESQFADASYRNAGRNFADYRNAYRYGTYARSAFPGRSWDEAFEAELESGWERVKGTSPLTWPEAKPATRDAWQATDSVPELGAAVRG